MRTLEKKKKIIKIIYMAECKHPIIVYDLGIDEKTGKHITKCLIKTPDMKGDPYEWARTINNKNKNVKAYVLGCGKCLDCKHNYSKEKSIRCYCESLYSVGNYFVTLTYNNEHLPKDDPTLERVMRDQLNNLIRNLKFTYPNLKYFAGAERGDQFGRPHIHINFFNTPFKTYTNSKGHIKSTLLNKLWKYGLHDIRRFEPGTAQYTAGYTSGELKNTIFISQSRNLGERYVLDKSEIILQTGNIPIKGKLEPMGRWAFKILEKNGFFIDQIKSEKDQAMKSKLTYLLKNRGITYDEYIEELQKQSNIRNVKRKGADFQ